MHVLKQNNKMFISFKSFRSLPDGSYKVEVKDSLEKYDVYCHMTEIPGCGPGGWTLVMKIDGNKV